MRATVSIMLSLLMVLATPARGQESSAKPEQPDVAKTEPVPVAAEKSAQKEFVPPDGWRPKKRGEFTVYCRKDQVKGTRIPAEVCYDEAGLRAMLIRQVEDQENVDQMRRICAGDSSCGTH
jgi:hypothetical protein